MNKVKINSIPNTSGFSLQKYINKLKVGQAPAYIIGQDNSLGLKSIYHPAYDRTVNADKNTQISEFYGSMKDNHEYMNEEYKSLLLTLKNIDIDYSQSTVDANYMQNRIKLSKDAITSWKSFIDFTHNQLPAEEYTIRDDILIKMKDIYMRFKKRNKHTIPSEDILPFHNEFSKYYTFDFPVHPKNLAMMINPHWGYLCKFTKHEFSFEDIINFYQAEYASSFYRNNGRDLLANRVSAFNYWSFIDKDLKGFLTFNELVYLMEAMAFDVDSLTSENIGKKFPSTFAYLKNELVPASQNIYRFRLFEFLFMERTAIY